jgi:cyanophycin synthetase
MAGLSVARATGAGLRWLARYHRLRNRWLGATRKELSTSRRSDFYVEAWEEAAAEVGATVTRLDGALLEIRCGDVLLRARNNVTSLDDPVTLSVAGNKPLVHALLSARGIRVPRHVACGREDYGAAASFLRETRRPCVVKPASGTGGGSGVTTGVTGRLQLAAAMARAGAYCADLVVEEQIDGVNYRLLYFDGELLDAVERRPPSVRGDGISTLKQLIEAENADRTRRGIEASQFFLRVDREMRQTLHRSGRDMGTVPAAGEVVHLKTVVSDGRREDNIPATATLCDAIVAAAAEAAAAVGARLAGVDVITPDPSLPLAESGGAICEVNTTPGYYYHYKTAGEPVPVALLILRRLCDPAR